MRNYSHDGLDFTYMKKVHYSMRDSNAKVGTGPGRGNQMVELEGVWREISKGQYVGERKIKIYICKGLGWALAVCIGRARENYKFSTSITSRATLF